MVLCKSYAERWTRSGKCVLYTILVVIAASMLLVDTVYSEDPPYRFQHIIVNPTPPTSGYDAFGFSIATQDDKIIVGSSHANPPEGEVQAVYIFDSDSGEIIQTLYNPTPSELDSFGHAVAVDSSHIFISSPTDDAVAPYSGAVYMFDPLTGNLIRTFQKPTPSEGDNFGDHIAVKDGFLLVGATNDDAGAVDAGAAYLFNTQTGDLVQTFLNPTPATEERFGKSCTFVEDKVLIGASWASIDGPNQGEAYLFDITTGNLIVTLHKPEGSSGTNYGYSSASNDNTFIIGSITDTIDGITSGAAYLYDSLTGDLLRTFKNPTPEDGDWFGHSFAYLDNYILIGALGDDTVGEDSGAVYLFDITTGDLLHTFYHPYPSQDERLGFAIALTSQKLVFSAILDSTAGFWAGAVLMYIENTPIDSEQFLYVASEPNMIKRYDGTTGEYIDDFCIGGDSGYPYDFTFGPDGYLYVTFPEANEVKRFNRYTGEYIDTFIPSGYGGIIGPSGIRFAPDHNLYVCSMHTDEVKCYNGETGEFISNFAQGNGLTRPSFMFWWNDLYVASEYSNEVKRFDGDTGAFIENFVTSGSGGLTAPTGIIFQADGYLYVVSFGTDQVKRYDEDEGYFIENFVYANSGGLDGPVDLQFADDRLHVTSYWTNEVKRYDGGTGEFVDNFIPAGRGGLWHPTAIRIMIKTDPPPENGPDGPITWPPPPHIIIIIVVALMSVSTVVWRYYFARKED